MNTFTIKFWHGEEKNVECENIKTAFELNFGGFVNETGYNDSGVWLDMDENANVGYVFNNNGDHCATITLITPEEKAIVEYKDINTGELKTAEMFGTDYVLNQRRLRDKDGTLFCIADWQFVRYFTA